MPSHSNPSARPAGTRRPSTSIDPQIASSNATAQAFLGGRQLPSWMSGTTPTTTPTPRKPNPRPAVTRQPVVQAVQPPVQVVLPSPAPSDEPIPALSNLLDSPNPPPAPLPDAQTMGLTATSTSATHPVTEARFTHVPAASDPEVQEVPRPATAGPVPSFNHLVRPLSNGSQNMQDRHNRSLSFEGASPTVPHGSLPPLKRRRTDQPPPARPAPSTSFLPILEQQIQSCGGDQALNASIERPRVLLLKEACLSDDNFFLVVHQLFAIWSQSAQDVHRVLPLDPAAIDSAFGVLETILKKNQYVSPKLQHWFARFPTPVENWTRGPDGYPVLLVHVAAFLEKLAKDYSRLVAATTARNYPFLFEELVLYLACYSPVLQLIIFTACRRRLGVPDGPLGSQMEAAFHQDKETHHPESATQPNFVAPKTPGQIEQSKAQLISFYKQIVSAATLRSPAYSPAAPNIQHQAASTPNTMATLYPPMYPSAALPLSSQVPANVRNPYTTFQGANGRATIQTGLASNIQMPQPRQTPSNLTQQYRGTPVPSSVPNQHLQAQAQHFQRPHVVLPQLRAQRPSVQNQQQLSQQQQLTSIQNPPQLAQQRQLNLQNYQLNSQQLGNLQAGYTATQSPTSPLTSPHPTQNIQNIQQLQPAQQVRPMQHPQQVRPTAAPQRLASHRAHHRSSQQPRSTVRDALIPQENREIIRPDYPYDPSDRKAIMMSLHQAHVRSPKRIVKSGATERFYQSVKSLAVGPAPIPPKNTMYEFRFEVSEEQLALAAAKSKTNKSLLPVVEHFSGALRWRIRCCVTPTSSKIPSEQQWVTLDVSWPPNIFMSLNNHALDIRRMPHNGRDLATEVTDIVVCGTNILKIGLPDPQREPKTNRFVAVEMVETLSHSSIVDSVWRNGMVPKETTLKTIKHRLTSSCDDDVSSDPELSIDLADPFSATIFKVPARGASCTHMECFDLETWLNTRPAKPHIRCPHGPDQNPKLRCACPNSAEPSNPDKWRCPICSKDARPYSLRVDGFLLAVRRQLEEEGRLQTKNMKVKADGEWTVVVEAEDEDSEAEEDGLSSGAKAPSAAVPVGGGGGGGVRRPEVEVIEVD